MRLSTTQRDALTLIANDTAGWATASVAANTMNSLIHRGLAVATAPGSNVPYALTTRGRLVLGWAPSDVAIPPVVEKAPQAAPMAPAAYARPSADPAGMVVYEGPSRLTGAPVVAILTFRTKNPKTGDMAQLWILDATVEPVEAVKTGADASVCGGCPHRGVSDGAHAVGRSCYVNVGFAPQAVYKAWRAGRYPVATDSGMRAAVAGRPIRLGAYGDPAAVPINVLRRVLAAGKGHTGYTHAWRDMANQSYKHILMASADSPGDYVAAKALGWRTFRVRLATSPILTTEVSCPASDEAGKRRDCASCKACDGADRAGKRDVVIIGHGGKAALANVNRALASLMA